MKKNQKIIISIVAVIALIAILLGVYTIFKPKAVEGTKAYTVSVTDAEGETVSYSGMTDAEFLSDLMDELVEEGDFSYVGDAGEYGLYITTINGLEANYDTDGAYWSIYVNGEYGQYGADSQPVTDGDEYSFVYEVYVAQ
ncbi:MAG: DUF4430 domain-containing protein [Butyrivibrio sp.]|nr:DUF4430 domain-containing protein [Butyrivibrio sp.]